MANPVPSDKLVDLQKNAQTTDTFVNSNDLTVTARPTPTDPAGKVIRTLAGIDADVELALQRIGVQYSDPIKDWTPTTEITAFEAHRYPATTGDIYIPTAPLPFTTGATFDSDNWTLLQGVNSAYLETRLSEYTNEGINDISQTYTFKTAALMKASLIIFPVGKKIYWQGYYEQSDGGSNWGVVESGEHTDDGGSIFTLSDGKYVRANLKGNTISVLNFGAKADGDELNPSSSFDSTLAIQSAINYCESLVFDVPSVDPQGGADIRIPSGSYVISAALRVKKGNISISGQSMPTIIPNMSNISPDTCACIIVGTGEEWLSSGTISSTTKYNSISGIRFSRLEGASPIGILLSGVRSCDISRIHAERIFCGIWLENASETTFEQITNIGTTYGIVGDSRKSRGASSSPLGVANIDNDVSANNWRGISCYYPQHTGILLINTGSTSIMGATIGRFSENPTPAQSLRYGLSNKNAGVHYWGGGTNFTKGGLLSDIVFEADPTTSKTCVLVTSQNKNNPIRGLVFDALQVQTWAADHVGGNVTVLVQSESYNDGAIDGCVLRNSGFRFATDGNNYPTLFEKTSDSAVGQEVYDPNFVLEDNYPSASISTSDIGNSVITNNYPMRIVSMEVADLSPGNLPTDWINESGTISTGGGTGGVEPYLTFNGNGGGLSTMSLITRFRTYSTRIGSYYFSFWYKGDTAPFINVTANNVAATEIINESGDNLGRYSNALYTANNLQPSSRWKRVVITFLPFDPGQGGIDTIKFEIGRAINSFSNYTDIKGIELGYNTKHEAKYNPFA